VVLCLSAVDGEFADGGGDAAFRLTSGSRNIGATCAEIIRCGCDAGQVVQPRFRNDGVASSCLFSGKCALARTLSSCLFSKLTTGGQFILLAVVLIVSLSGLGWLPPERCPAMDTFSSVRRRVLGKMAAGGHFTVNAAFLAVIVDIVVGFLQSTSS
jgi:hypothetical protein